MRKLLIGCLLALILLTSVGCGPEVTPDDTDLGDWLLREETRKQIFYDLVALQDSGVRAEEAYRIIAEKYGTAAKVVKAIAAEGIEKDWPMPPP